VIVKITDQAADQDGVPELSLESSPPFIAVSPELVRESRDAFAQALRIFGASGGSEARPVSSQDVRIRPPLSQKTVRLCAERSGKREGCLHL
jgi:hypothetical protein